MRQIGAILLDSIRHLRSQSLFYIGLGLSLLVAVLLFGLLSINEQGYRILWFSTTESERLRAGTEGASDLLSWLFGGAFVYWWLTWGAVILAMISTASIIPDFIASGSIELTVSKPIRRLKLFATRVFGALSFMIAQVTLGVVAAYLLMGLRFDLWHHAALWAIPLVTLQFLYIYSVMVLVGMVTRSTLLGLLAGLLFWGCVSLFQFVNNQLDSAVAQSRAMVERAEDRIEVIRHQAAESDRELTANEASRIEFWRLAAEPNRRTLEQIEPWQRTTNRIVLVFPKTGDIQKIVAELVDAPTFNELLISLGGLDTEMFQAHGVNDRESAEDVMHSAIAGARAIREVETARSIGTSLIFTLGALGLAGLIFCRRDF